jgi:hypothetical protein
MLLRRSIDIDAKELARDMRQFFNGLLGDSDLFAELNVLDCVERASSRPPSGAGTPYDPKSGPMRPARLLKTAENAASAKSCAARFARIVPARTTQATIRHLVTVQVDRVVAGQLGVDTLFELAVTGERFPRPRIQTKKTGQRPI